MDQPAGGLFAVWLLVIDLAFINSVFPLRIVLGFSAGGEAGVAAEAGEIVPGCFGAVVAERFRMLLLVPTCFGLLLPG